MGNARHFGTNSLCGAAAGFGGLELRETAGIYLIRLLHDAVIWPSLGYESLVSLALQEEFRDYPADDSGPFRL